MSLNFDLSEKPDPLDVHRREFISDLDDATFDITNWEAEFLESVLGKDTFSPKQREVIDNLRRKYENKL